MILFFRASTNIVYAVGSQLPLQITDIQKLTWLFGGASPLTEKSLSGFFIGPRKEMVTPWSTNAVEITQTMGIKGIERMEEFQQVSDAHTKHDPMLQVLYTELNQDIYTIHHTPEPILEIDDVKSYSDKEGLALSAEEIEYLQEVSKKLGR